MRSSGAAIWQYGASLLEFSVAFLIICILSATILQRLLYVQEYAEKMAMELMISNLQTALRVKVGELLIADRAKEISALAGANPVDWLESQPENYRGARNGAPSADSKGQWYFDTATRELVYTAAWRSHFSSPTRSDYTVRLKVRQIPNTDEGSLQGQPVWVRLAVINDYTWF